MANEISENLNFRNVNSQALEATYNDLVQLSFLLSNTKNIYCKKRLHNFHLFPYRECQGPLW